MVSIAGFYSVCGHTNAEPFGCKQPIITVPGQYALSYEVFAENFPVLRFQIELQFTGKVETIQAEVNPESEAA